MSTIPDRPESRLQNMTAETQAGDAMPREAIEGARIFQRAVQQADTPVLLANEPGAGSPELNSIPRKADSASLSHPFSRQQVADFLQQHGFELTGEPRYADKGLLSTVLFVDVRDSDGAAHKLAITALHPGTTYVSDVASLAELLRQAGKAGAPIAKPLSPVDGEPVKYLGDLPALVLPFIPSNPNLESYREILHLGAARALATLHLHSGDADVLVDRYKSVDWGKQFLEWAEVVLPESHLGDMAGYRDLIEANALLYQDPVLPRGLIHGDASPGNFILSPDVDTYMIDYNLSGNGARLHDIGTAIMYFSTHKDNNGKVIFDLQKAHEFIQMYSSVRSLTEPEAEHLLSFLAMRSTRSLGTHINFYNEHVAEKSDGEALQAAEARFAESFHKQLAYLKFFTMLQAVPSIFAAGDSDKGATDDGPAVAQIDHVTLKRLLVSSLVAADWKGRAEEGSALLWADKLAMAIAANPHLTVLEPEKFEGKEHDWTKNYESALKTRDPNKPTKLLEESIKIINSLNIDLNVAVDLGAGSGFDSRMLLRETDVGQVIAVDQSPQAENFFWGGVSTADRQRLSFINSSFADLELPDQRGKVDLVFARSSLPYEATDKLPSLLKKIYEMLRPGGVFSANFFMPTHSVAENGGAGALLPAQIRSLLANFEILEINPVKHEFTIIESRASQIFKNHHYVVIARKPLEVSRRQKQQQPQQASVADVSDQRALQLKQQQVQQEQQKQFVEQPQQTQQAQQGPPQSASQQPDADTKRHLGLILQNTDYVVEGKVTDAGVKAVQQKQQELAGHHIHISFEHAAQLIEVELLENNSDAGFIASVKEQAHAAVRTALFQDLDQFSRGNDFSSQHPLARYSMVYQRYGLDMYPMSVLDAIQGHEELREESSAESASDYFSTVLPYVQNNPVEAVFKLMFHFFHEPHLLEGNPDNYVDVRDIRSQVTVNMLPQVITDLSNARQAADAYRYFTVRKSLLVIADPALASINQFLRGGELPERGDFERWLADLEHMGLNYTEIDHQSFEQLKDTYKQIETLRAGDIDQNRDAINALTVTARANLKRLMDRRLGDIDPQELLEQHVAGEAMRRATGADDEQRHASEVLSESISFSKIKDLVNRLWSWANNASMPSPREVEQNYMQIIGNREYNSSTFAQAAHWVSLSFAYRRGDISAEELVRQLATEYLPEAVSQLNDTELVKPGFIQQLKQAMEDGLIAAREADKAAAVQTKQRLALFEPLNEFTRQNGFNELSPLERYRRIYENFDLQQHNLTVLDAIQGHRELINGSAPATEQQLIDSLHISGRYNARLFKDLMFIFFHEPHLLEGNPDDSTDLTNIRSIITVNMYPDMIPDLGNGAQAANLYAFESWVGGLALLGTYPVGKINPFLRGGDLPSSGDFNVWKQKMIGIGINHIEQDRLDFAALEQKYEQAKQMRWPGQLTGEIRDLMLGLLQRRFPDVTAEGLRNQYVAGEAFRRLTGANQQHRNAVSMITASETPQTLEQIARQLWAWADQVGMPSPAELEALYEQLIQSNEYPVEMFQAAAEAANFESRLWRGEIDQRTFMLALLEKNLPNQPVRTTDSDFPNDQGLIGWADNTLKDKLISDQKALASAAAQENTPPQAKGNDAIADQGTTDSLRDQVSDASSNALVKQYQGFAEESNLFNLKDQQQNAGYTNFSFHKKVERGPGTIGVAPYDLPGLLSGKDGDLTAPVETGAGQATQTDYTPAQIAPATISTGNTAPEKPAAPSPIEPVTIEQIKRDTYKTLSPQLQAQITEAQFLKLDLEKLDLSDRYTAYQALHPEVRSFSFGEYLGFQPEIIAQLEQWSNQNVAHDKKIESLSQQAAANSQLARELDAVTAQIRQNTEALQASAVQVNQQNNVRIESLSTAQRSVPPAQWTGDETSVVGTASNNIIGTIKAGAPIGGKASTNVPMISLTGKTGLGQYTQSSTIPKYLYKPDQQGQLQLHIVKESGNQLSLQAVPLSVYKPQNNIGTHYNPQNGWQSIPQLSAAQQNQINQYLQQSTFIMPSPVIAPTVPAGSSVPAPVSVPVP